MRVPESNPISHVGRSLAVLLSISLGCSGGSAIGDERDGGRDRGDGDDGAEGLDGGEESDAPVEGGTDEAPPNEGGDDQAPGGDGEIDGPDDPDRCEGEAVDRGCGCGEDAPNGCGSCDGTVVDAGCGCGEPAANDCGSCDGAVDEGCGCGAPAPNECESCDPAVVDDGCGCGNPGPNACGSCDGAIVEEGCELDLSLVNWLHTDVSGWPVTSTVTNVTVQPGEVCVFHTRAGQWPFSTEVFPPDDQHPAGAPIEGNIWIFGFIGGEWYAATWDWLRPGQECKHESSDTFGRDQIRIAPMDETWIPQEGDTIGLMMSTIARTALRAGEERTKVMLLTWPY